MRLLCLLDVLVDFAFITLNFLLPVHALRAALAMVCPHALGRLLSGFLMLRTTIRKHSDTSHSRFAILRTNKASAAISTASGRGPT